MNVHCTSNLIRFQERVYIEYENFLTWVLNTDSSPDPGPLAQKAFGCGWSGLYTCVESMIPLP